MWKNCLSSCLWKTENLSTFFSTYKKQHPCGFDMLFHKFFLYYYCY